MGHFFALLETDDLPLPHTEVLESCGRRAEDYTKLPEANQPAISSLSETLIKATSVSEHLSLRSRSNA